MTANYHTHTFLCRHASGTPRESAETAVRNGLSVLGFSDHVPCPFHNGHRSDFRMDVAETGQYIRMIEALRNEYRGRLRILIGYESEYYPREFDGVIGNIRRYECDYLILGQHFLNNEYDGAYCGEYTEDPERLRLYVEAVTEGIGTGKFSCVAHPDLIQFRGDDALYEKLMLRLCECAKEAGIPLEINMLGIRDRRAYPYDPFWELAKKTGNRVILGCDAHEPKWVGEPGDEAAARAYAARFGIVPEESMELIRIS